MAKIFTPANQLKITNVAVVRMKKCGIRFEIACYKNKVLPWRNKEEKDVEEVLQTHTVFTNVSKGQFAKRDDLIKAFGTDDQTKICLEILAKGELQITDKERAAHLDALTKEVAHIITNKCVNPDYGRPYPYAVILQTMKDAHVSLKQTKCAKQLALEVIPKLQHILPLKRAQMRMKVVITKDADSFREKLKNLVGDMNSESKEGSEHHLEFLMDPGLYRQVDEITNTYKGRLDILNIKEFNDNFELPLL